MIKLITLLTLVFSLSVGCAAAKEEVSKPLGTDQNSETKQDNAPQDSAIAGELYRQRYVLANASEKLVDNQGRGFAGLYGTRNFRAVLNGVYYRGGANNVYFVPKRDNSNPLTDTGLQNLCKEGFAHAVYLYSTNFNTAPKQVRCRTFAGEENTLTYLQISPLSYRDSDLRTLHGLINDRIRDPRLGPIYDHCWNGWHASGYVAATALRQFCGFTAEQAVDYWNKNTDGNNGSSYNKVRTQIRAFVPNSDFTLSAEEKAVFCPSPSSLAFAGQ